MERHEIQVNGRNYTVTLNDRTNLMIVRLRRLYSASYGDVESFDEISTAISDTINELKKHAITPEPNDEDLDGIVQELFKLAEKRASRG
ncbi:MAG: hypothetical protein D6752_02615 [Candidatus Nitrosothermus koennekii]|jgi:hypothetical protein|nr:MAG: hypothetical protein D6752_02615 [Candidatus Nitrosothermus koennekii]